MTSACVVIRGVSKTYPSSAGRARVLDNIDLEIRRGERVAVVGPNGSGKTTLLRIILGLDYPDVGTVSRPRFETEHAVSYVPQDYRNALFPWFRLSTNLALASANSSPEQTGTNSQIPPDGFNHPFKALAETYRLSVELTKYPYQLSGGEQQIFLLIRAVLSRPALLVLDEPLSAVDFGRKRLIQEHLGCWVPETQTTLVFASHDFEEAVMLSDRVVVLARDSGKVKAIMNVDLPWPRTPQMRQVPLFRSYVEDIIGTLL